ncbi:sirohydrochlorin chelatase [Ampullimonas aquatilis]|uniref:sirohydrochlorin chelatase n=1 Tax=Ampullimonas aquatilis TaxID=1341549 RepID=UPI003C7513F8
MTQALILFGHGARDPRWAEPFERLRDKLATHLPAPQQASLAFLELMTPSLADAVAQQIANGSTQITIIPVFFGQGGHIRKDLPALIETIRAKHPNIIIQCAPAVGEDDAVLNAITSYCLAQLN